MSNPIIERMQELEEYLNRVRTIDEHAQEISDEITAMLADYGPQDSEEVFKAMVAVNRVALTFGSIKKAFAKLLFDSATYFLLPPRSDERELAWSMAASSLSVLTDRKEELTSRMSTVVDTLALMINEPHSNY